mgnify:CR=1 FL=1
MNQFDKIIEKEKTKQNFIYIFVFILIFAVAILLILYFLYSKGVNLVITPNEVSKSSVINIIKGKGIIYNNKLISLSNKITIEIIAKGYKKNIANINLNNSKKNISIRLEELPGSVIVKSNISSSKTKWYLNDRFITESKNLEIELQPGSYKLKVFNEFYNEEFLDFTITKGKQSLLSLKLEKINVKVFLNSDPENARIYLNDKNIGVTPYDTILSGGIYNIRIEKEHYASIYEEIILNNEINSLERNYKLDHLLVPVKFIVSPLDGFLLVNGKQIVNNVPINLNPAETHIVTYSKPGYISETKNVNLKLLKENLIKINLNKDIGLVEVTSSPSAQVYVNNQLYGDSPLSLKLQSLPHEIKILKDGYIVYKKTITPSSNIDSQIKVNLETILESRLKNNGKEFKNSIGIIMKLFKPSDFKMGASRYEKGQRANEFIKQIILRKYFYISTNEITNEIYNEFSKKNFTKEKKKLPITNITWIEAAKFCNWLSKKEGLKDVYNIDGDMLVDFDLNVDGYRLPTEAEWEWLARKANKKSQTKFTWGLDKKIPKFSGNLADESAKGRVDIYIPGYNDNFVNLSPVGSFPMEPSGLFDMTGNVSEWIHDFYLLIPPDEGIIYYDPSGPKEGSSHVVKGSNFKSGTLTELRASYRDSELNKRDNLGFRIVRYVYGKELKNDEK